VYIHHLVTKTFRYKIELKSKSSSSILDNDLELAILVDTKCYLAYYLLPKQLPLVLYYLLTRY